MAPRIPPPLLLPLATVALVLGLSGCRGCAQRDAQPPSQTHFVQAHQGVVVSVSGPASLVGLSILQQGGNAVDAAVATAFALAVAYPPAGNLGGGGFLLVHPKPGAGPPIAYDYREAAPLAATPTMFSKNESQFTHKAVAVPGTVSGFALAHSRFGSLPWAQLIAPAIKLARDGFVVDPNLADSMNVTLAATREFKEFQRVFGKPGGGPWKAGDTCKQSDLARTLTLLAQGGSQAFYTGAIAVGIVAEMQRGKGLITTEDLQRYHAIERQPLTMRYRNGYDVYVPPAPSSGGTVLLEELQILQTFDLKAWGRFAPPTIHVMVEAMRRANYDRARYLGDPDFTSIPAELTTPAYGRKLAAAINLNRATPSTELTTDIPLSDEGENTTHFSIIDHEGMAVANTYTIERRWGSRIVVTGMGFLLNNDMFAFNLFPGLTDRKGAIGTAPNTIAPNKRPLTSQTPTIVAKNGHVALVTGSPGSRAIPHTILEILVSVLDFGMSLPDAVAAPRFSHQWLPDQITFEDPEHYESLCKALGAQGHNIVRSGPLPQGDAHSIWVSSPGTYVGVADRRINGRAAGY